MTENDEKVAEELARRHDLRKIDEYLRGIFKSGFLAGIAYERARNKANLPKEQTVNLDAQMVPEQFDKSIRETKNG